MSNQPRFVPLFELSPGIEELRAEAGAEGFRFVDKLVTEWNLGQNRFAAPGEVLLGAFRASRLVAVGGLNRDPYADQLEIGRLRHLYVERAARRSGIGSALVRQLLERARGVFQSVRLRTDTQEAADFYGYLGFRLVCDRAATHVWSW
jgi:GNAT superfamily N-acetyltransferase